MTVDFPRSWVTPCCMILWGDWLCTDTAGRLTQRSMILQGDWLCADLNQNRWYFNPLVTGQWPRQIRMMKKGGRKSRCTVPLRQCHALSFKSFILEIFLIKCLTILGRVTMSRGKQPSHKRLLGDKGMKRSWLGAIPNQTFILTGAAGSVCKTV